MGDHLLLTLRLHEDGQGCARYHGTALGAPEWPPSPARVFQAIVAGSARGNALPHDLVTALEWLERLPPPVIAAPRVRHATPYSLFVPNNDADAVSDPRDISGIRTKKRVQALILEGSAPVLYAWSLAGDSANANAVIAAADRVYQLGRGIDMAWASAEIVGDAALESRLCEHRGVIHQPEPGGRERLLACPIPGSLASLIQRQRAPKLTREGTGRGAKILFTNPPKPRFLNVSYEPSRERLIFELRTRADEAKAWPFALHRVVALVEELRDGAVRRLRAGLSGEADAIERVLVGRRPDASTGTPPAQRGSTGTASDQRVRIIPLPSVGHRHADRAIRRVLVDVPSGAELSTTDVEWAFSGLEPVNRGSGEPRPFVLIRTDDRDMLRHYMGPSRCFRSVTPVALPEAQARRRIDPAKRRTEPKPGSERALEEDRAAAAVHTALRHAGVRETAVAIRVQREPFEANGARVEPFAEDTRFAKERLFHIELEFARPLRGPLVLGDGRFLGLGVMAPVQEPFTAPTESDCKPPHPHIRHRREPQNHAGLYALAVENPTRQDSEVLARALRRAVMARVQAELGSNSLDRFFSGHEPDGERARAEHDNHLAFHWDPLATRLLVIAPHWLERREPTWDERRSLDVLARALEHFHQLRTSRNSLLRLRLQPLAPADPLRAPHRVWTSVTPYAVTRHAEHASASEALNADLVTECQRRGLPRPEVRVLKVRGVPGRGLQGLARLEFAVAVGGPILLGRSRYLGGGLFGGLEGS